ncbi:conserved Plasmodium protein, unknown function [Plasmodium berghei]|uniref:Membrane protein Pbs54 n=3 Tax=Plasmodium berghei TaxID=5821 RepID=PBS54_PLABA|nr:conserved protein, unknown function [Plasmodium berghei ANKA]SCO59610.1 conserved Plasmodium protein, unknown function [Plasmodium berghei]VUC55291.1 conserved protein, unknown function [Plasmodium berghei ANKA]|eukprot:XP_034421104.1 conserved protein, unknown function [Plasmodium berghei ANKA]
MIIDLFQSKKLIISIIILILRISLFSCAEHLFFNNNFNFFNFSENNHAKVNELNIDTKYLYQGLRNINIYLALSALNGITKEKINDISQWNGYKTRNNDETNISNVVVTEWKQLNKKSFFLKNNNISNNDNLIKGMPNPYFINSLTEDINNINLYFNIRNDIKYGEIIYKGTYIPHIYNNIFLIFLISYMYWFCIKILFNGYIKGKYVAKEYILKISTLFIFFVILKISLIFLPAILSCIVCLILTFYFYSISMSPCKDIFYLFESTRIKKEPIGWIIIVYAESILIGNVIYNFLCPPKIIIIFIRYIQNDFLVKIICLTIILFISFLIFFLMISNIFPAKKAQNFVFSFTSSYLIVSCFAYFWNIFLLRFLNNTNIFQIEPIMFFSYTPKFVFNRQNMFALFMIFAMSILSIIFPRIKKLKQNIFDMKENIYDSDIDIGKASKNRYNIILNYFT